MSRQPNILFIISDQHRWDALCCAGHPIVQTPNLDRLAAEGVRFTDAYCQSPLCITSRASLMTGLYPHTCRAYTNKAFPLPDGIPTLGSVFRQAGYRTGAIGKVHVRGETRQRDLGFDDRALRLYTYNFEDYIRAVGEAAVDVYATYRKPLARYQTSYNPTNSPIALDESRMFDALVVDQCIAFMEKHRDRPFFLWAGIDKPHPDWTAPAEFHRTYDPARIPLPLTVYEDRRDIPEAWFISTRQAWCFDEPELHACMAAYYANVTYMDSKVGQLLAALKRLGLDQQTIVVYTTDHGEMLFDHGMVQKQNFFEASVRVPLIFRAPGHLPSGLTIPGCAGLIDLFPTFCDLTDTPPPSRLEGRSLRPELTGHRANADHPVLSEYYEWGFPERMVRRGEWKYMVAHGDVSQLYHLRADPHEQHNRIDHPDVRDIRHQLHREAMDGWEIPDMTQVPFGGPWNQREEWVAGADAFAQRRALH